MNGQRADVVAATATHLRRLWRDDRPAVGLWSMLTDRAVAELVAGTDFDYVCIDLQHGLSSFGDLPGLVQAMRSSRRAPVVRVPWNHPAQIMRALDSGAVGVIVPMVDTAEQAARAVAACRFPPEGSRSWGPMWGGVLDGAPPPDEQDTSAMCIVMIETAAAVAAADEIASVPGVDAVYIGPNDLALGCGYGRATYRDSAEVEQLIQGLVDTCRAAGVVAGLHCSDAEMVAYWARRGVRMLTAGHDTTIVREAVDGARRDVAEALREVVNG